MRQQVGAICRSRAADSYGPEAVEPFSGAGRQTATCWAVRLAHGLRSAVAGLAAAAAAVFGAALLTVRVW